MGTGRIFQQRSQTLKSDKSIPIPVTNSSSTTTTTATTVEEQAVCLAQSKNYL
jgi:LysM repeat protein